MIFIDTHLHLSAPDYRDDLEIVLKRAEESSVKYFINIGSGYGADGFQDALDISAKYNIFFALGVHPHDADLGLKISVPDDIYNNKLDEILKRIERQINNPKLVGVGEIGLDYYYNHSEKRMQKETFERFLFFSSAHQLPVIIHSRDAFLDTVDIIKSTKKDIKGVFHCFSYNLNQAKQILDMGFYISIPGIVTFKNATDMKEVVRYIPDDRILVETDAPFLAPVPYRGKRNEPSFIVETYKAIAMIRNTTIEELAKVVLANSLSAFRISKGDIIDTD